MAIADVLAAPGAAVDRLPRGALAHVSVPRIEADGQVTEAQQWQAAFAISKLIYLEVTHKRDTKRDTGYQPTFCPRFLRDT